MSRFNRTVRHYLPALVVAVAGIGLWEGLIRALQVRSFFLPAPTAIVTALIENWDTGRQIFPAAQTTLYEAAGGLVIGTVLGVAVAFLVGRFATVRDAILPLAIAVNAIPIVAFAPLANNWFGTLSPYSKMAIAGALVFFPIMINVLRGLTQVDAASLELMRSYAASDRTVLAKVRIPNALPFFLTGLKVGTTLALIGAVVGEYFGGLNVALGRVVVESASALAFEVTWAAILVTAVTGIAMYLLVAGVERLAIPWHPSVRGEQIV